MVENISSSQDIGILLDHESMKTKFKCALTSLSKDGLDDVDIYKKFNEYNLSYRL